jgi:hypothetical protein
MTLRPGGMGIVGFGGTSPGGPAPGSTSHPDPDRPAGVLGG